MLQMPRDYKPNAHEALRRNAEAWAETVHGKEKAAGVTSTKRLPNLPPNQVGKAAVNALYHNTHRL
jgi:hypothetical protein